ncbi:unnamed protein product [Rotaria sp. Silwood1]|nr:unnamed protein product [Rotaria sp. Silwood1]
MDKVKERTGIYHEHQEGALCAQHALNNLLQTPLFSADNLADIARELDKEENSVLTHTLYESENMDDTGFFNIQVLQLALKMFDLELISFASQEDIARQARNNPQSIQAYICNLGLHWFTIRRFGRQYFDLNSMFYVPQLIPGELLIRYFNTIQKNGYSVFIVHGSLPDCLADQQLAANPISLREYEVLTKDLRKMIIDDKVIENSKNLQNKKLTIPKDLYDACQKNANDPRIKQRLLSYIPDDMLGGDIVLQSDSSDHQHDPHRRLLILSTMPKQDIDEQLIENCDCAYHRRVRQNLKNKTENSMINDPFTDISNEPDQESPMITRVITRQVIEKPNFNNSSKSQQQRVELTREMIFISKSSPKDKTLNDNYGVQQMSTTKIGFLNNKDDVQQLKMSRSLLDALTMKMDPNISLDENHTEKMNQQKPDANVAASLTSNNSITKQVEETSEPTSLTNTNSSSTPVINSEQTSIVNSSSAPTINSKRTLTQYVLEKPNPDNSNKSQEQQKGVTRRMVIITQSSQRNNPLFDDHRVQRGPTTGIEFDNEENGIWEDVIPDSLLGSSIMNMDDNMPFDVGRIEKWNQQNLEAAIAASLRSNNSTTTQVEEPPESNPLTTMNSSPLVSAIDSEQTPTINSSPASTTNSEQTSKISSSPAPTFSSEQTLTQYVVEKPNPDNSNKSQEQQIGATRQMVIITQSSQRNNPLFDDQRDQRTTITGIGFNNEENGIWQDVMPDSLLGSSIMNMDGNMPFDADHIEKWNQQNLEAAIAASLRTNNSTTPQTEETSELIPLTTMNSLQPSPSMNSEQTPTISLEPITINNPTPSTTSNSSPPTNINSPLPTVTDPDVIKSLNIEGKLFATISYYYKIRRRRLVTNGFREKSIIAQQSNFDD